MKRIIAIICAIILMAGFSCPVFANTDSVLPVAQNTEDKPLRFQDKGTKTTVYQQGCIEYEIPSDWIMENRAGGTMFKSSTSLVIIQSVALKQSLATKDEAELLMNDVLDQLFTNNSAFDKVDVLSKKSTTFLSSYATYAEISTTQGEGSAKNKVTIFTTPDLKRYGFIIMPVVSVAAAGDIGVEMDKVLTKVSNDMYEMVLNSVKWIEPQVEQKQEEKPDPKEQVQQQPQGQTAYWTPSGKSYHYSQNCTALKRSKTIKSGTLGDAKSAGKSDPCNLCAKG